MVAAEEFAAKDLSQARNMAALFTSLIKVTMDMLLLSFAVV